ncbi:hypothetical protein CEXT_671951 [Caerostris extrusa]|uniref:Uncharacterized protein n=1 Tax=Caerostris extrusa TaxID=172846 RepID=A0AAV4WFQ1_CAEEX|nr:hypothetical protein CEXT_671951 [Caerostris extrusa]
MTGDAKSTPRFHIKLSFHSSMHIPSHNPLILPVPSIPIRHATNPEVLIKTEFVAAKSASSTKRNRHTCQRHLEPP